MLHMLVNSLLKILTSEIRLFCHFLHLAFLWVLTIRVTKSYTLIVLNTCILSAVVEPLHILRKELRRWIAVFL